MVLLTTYIMIYELLISIAINFLSHAISIEYLFKELRLSRMNDIARNITHYSLKEKSFYVTVSLMLNILWHH